MANGVRRRLRDDERAAYYALAAAAAMSASVRWSSEESDFRSCWTARDHGGQAFDEEFRRGVSHQ